MLFRLQFGGRDVDVIKMETRIVYDGVYTYRFNEGANSGGFEYCAGFQQPRRLRHGGREYFL